ncbi:transposase [Pseudomonas aeruginosa]|uniref:Tn7-like element transposition protein TnsE n=1 Tax=Pseudomonas aeruginosa TaxID=287 RepID=UPI000FD2AAA9|nr:Tn7-like element transposition protein TnsE [Pseudomonas aeruginosa]RUH99053.1 transposase [Pseudomonas aeruginosa]
MNRTLFRQIQTGSRLLAIGNLFRAPTAGALWRLAALFERNGQLQLQRFPLEMSCVLAVGREFPGEEGTPYRPSGFQKTVVLPVVDTWRERPLGECPRLARRLAANPEISEQRCFVFETDGLTVWLPKFELARKLFFHAAFIVRAAFEPNGLDMAFTIYRESDAVHIHTPTKTGAPSQLLRVKGYRDHFSWLLLNQDVKRSFESIWQSLNQEQERVSQVSAYARWKFDFTAPISLAGTTMHVRGPFDPKSNELLVWEIETLQGLRFTHRGDVFFHHPALKLPVRGENTGCMPVPSGAEEVEVDADGEPTAAKEPRLIHLPVEGINFDGQLTNKIAYNGERAGTHGKRVDDEHPLGGESTVFGVADPVRGGSIAPGEFQLLGDGEIQQRFSERFSQLSELIKQITQESDIELLSLDVAPLPQVPRCRYHMIDDETPRCYLLARFRLENRSERYLLEIETSDNRKRMSTRIMGIKASIEDARQCIDRILRGVVKGSLRWPSTMARYCEPLQSVHHPKDDPSGVNQNRSADWKQRIRVALS